MYLDFAELQALNKQPMHMKDWVIKLDDFLRITTGNILSHAGKISHQAALNKAREEYQKYQDKLESNLLSTIEKHFLQSVKEVEQIDIKS